MPSMTDYELRIASKMLVNQAEIIASNFCLAWGFKSTNDVNHITRQLLQFFADKVNETTEEMKGKGV